MYGTGGRPTRHRYPPITRTETLVGFPCRWAGPDGVGGNDLTKVGRVCVSVQQRGVLGWDALRDSKCSGWLGIGLCLTIETDTADVVIG